MQKTKKRSTFLTVVIIYAAINSLLGLYNVFNPRAYDALSLKINGETLLLMGFLNIVQLLGAYGLYQWKRWGALAMFFVIAANIILQIAVLHVEMSLFVLTLILSSIVAWPIHKNWSKFK